MQYESVFKAVLKDSRLLKDTTFIMEDLSNNEKGQIQEWVDKVDLAFDKYAIANNGGCIVVAHDKDRDDNSGYVTKLTVYDSYCNKISEIPLKQEANIKKMFVTPEECVIVVFGSGCVASYNLRGVLLSQNDEYDGLSISVIFAAFWDHGLYVVASTNKVYVYDNFANLKAKFFSNYGGPLLMDGVAVPPDSNAGTPGHLWAFNSEGQIALFQQDDYDVSDFQIKVIGMAFSPDYKIACVYSEDSFLFCEPDFSKVLLVDSFDEVQPQRIVWCGSDTVLLLAQNTIVMIGAASQAMKWEYDSTIAASSEVDGARVFTQFGTKLIRAIPAAPHEFAIWNPKSPQVRLFISVLDEEELAIHDTIKDFSIDELYDAMINLMESAIFFTSYSRREPLLTAISRAMIMMDPPKDDGTDEDNKLIYIRDFDTFADKLSTLRVVHTMGHPPYNIPMTFPQFETITSSVLIKRICNRSLHVEAYRIAIYLRVPTELIAAHWANCLVHTDLEIPDILERLKKMEEPIDYIDLATTAFNAGRNDLALALLNENPAKARGVPLLIDRNKWDEALTAAVDSSDTSLIVYALEKAREEEQDDALANALLTSPIVRGTWLCVCDDEAKEEITEICGELPFDKMNRMIYDLEDTKEAQQELNKYKKELKDAKDTLHSDVYNMFTQLKKMEKELSEINFDPKKDTVYSALEKFIAKKDMKKANQIAKILDLSKEDLTCRRILVAVKTDDLFIIQSLCKDVKVDYVKQFIPWAEKLGNADVVKCMYGADPNVVRPPPEEEPEKKKGKRRGRKAKEEEEKKKAEEEAKKGEDGENKEGEDGEKKEGEEGEEKKEGEEGDEKKEGEDGEKKEGDDEKKDDDKEEGSKSDKKDDKDDKKEDKEDKKDDKDDKKEEKEDKKEDKKKDKEKDKKEDKKDKDKDKDKKDEKKGKSFTDFLPFGK